jgi:cation-transporting ATPase E
MQVIEPVPAATRSQPPHTGATDRHARTGLGSERVEQLRRFGRTNATALPTSRSYGRIVRDNVLTFINAVLFGLAVALIALGRTSDALISIGVVAVNMVVGLAQEIHAKRVLDHIAVVTRPHVSVVRDGWRQTIDPTEVVAGDLLIASQGDQIVGDGLVVGERVADVDEALLTGESDRIPKRSGDQVFAGTFCAGGSLEYIAEQVGTDSTANRLASNARAFRRVLTPLQHEINRIVRVSLVVVVVFEVLVALANALDRTSLVESVRMAVVIAGLIPNGLFLAIAVAYAVGAVRIAGRGALVQQANAVESLSHVDVLCLDKTGTMTTNGFQFSQTLALNGSDGDFRAVLGQYAASSSDSNRTLMALHDGLPARPVRALNEVLFSSARKWSALTLESASGPRHYVLGAPDVMESHLRPGERLPLQARQWASDGQRVLLLAQSPMDCQQDATGEYALPDRLESLGLATLSEELRDDAAATLAAFAAIGVDLRLLSGDDPHTVAAVARQAGLPAQRLVSGSELAELDPGEVTQLATDGAIFGRLAPEQKRVLVNHLRASGHYVAMIGDGINDVPALKAANLAIAMQSGTSAARAVSDIVLLEDRFAALPRALNEGQRIRGGMHAILKLFLSRVLYMALLIVVFGIIDIGFPFAPKQNALITLLTVGLPTLALAAWARPMEPHRSPSSVFHFVVPAACALVLMGLSVYAGYLLVGPLLTGGSAVEAINSRVARSVAQTALTTATILCGLVLILFVQPHGESITSWREVEWKHAALALTLMGLFMAIMLVPDLREMFELQALSPADFAVLACVTAVWSACLRSVWRWQALDRLLGNPLATNGPFTDSEGRIGASAVPPG